jgi:hypothetical protein
MIIPFKDHITSHFPLTQSAGEIVDKNLTELYLPNPPTPLR